MSCEYQNCFGGGEYCLLKISKNTLKIWESNFVDKCSLQNEHADLKLQKMILGYVNTGITVQPGTGYIYQSYLIHRYKYIYIYTSIYRYMSQQNCLHLIGIIRPHFLEKLFFKYVFKFTI